MQGWHLDEVGDDAGQGANIGAHVQRVDDKGGQLARRQLATHHLPHAQFFIVFQ